MGGARFLLSAGKEFSNLGLERSLGLELGVVCDAGTVCPGTGSSATCWTDGSVLLLEAPDTRGREAGKWTDCGLELKSDCDLAAGLTSGSATGIGAVVDLRLLLLPVRRRLCLPSSLDWTSRCAACTALID